MPTRSTILHATNYPFALITLFFGLSYTLSPRSSYDFFGFPTRPSTSADQALMDKIMVLYGAKDLYMGFVTLATLLYGTRKSAALVTLAGGLSAGIDGWVVGQANGWVGGNEWNHWGYGGVMLVLGLVQLVAGGESLEERRKRE